MASKRTESQDAGFREASCADRRTRRLWKVKATLKVTFTPFGGSPSSRIVQVKLKR